MTATTFIHTSDFQLGMTRWFLKGEAQGRFNDDREAAIMRLGELAKDTGAEFIVVAGDVFEHNALSREILARATEMFKRLPVPVYVLPGNHDPLVADSVFYKASADNVHVIADSEPIEVAVPFQAREPRLGPPSARTIGAGRGHSHRRRPRPGGFPLRRG